MPRLHDVRYRSDGSIDLDFYRMRATILRAQAMRDAFKPNFAFKFMLIPMVIIFGAATAAIAQAYSI